MTEINITEEQIKRAEELYSFGQLKDSVTKGKSNIIGAIGEVVVHDYFKHSHKVNFESTFDFDMTIDGLKIDVKSKKNNTPFPLNQEWVVNIFAFNTRQKCDYYFFLTINQKERLAHLCGYYKKDLFFIDAEFKKKGDKDWNGFLFKGDCYCMKIKDLKKFVSLN